MAVISLPGELWPEVRLECDRCGLQYPDVGIIRSDELRYDAQIRGWSYVPHHPRPDICPRCAERICEEDCAEKTPLDEVHQQWIYEEERTRDE